MAEDNPRILVLRGGAIGDFVVTLPALQALRARWPHAYIELVGYPHVAELDEIRVRADAPMTVEIDEFHEAVSRSKSGRGTECATTMANPQGWTTTFSPRQFRGHQDFRNSRSLRPNY